MSTTPELKDLEADLSNNALRFLRRAVAGITVTHESEDVVEHQVLTFAVVDLAVAIELLLKARLVREHWSLLFDAVDKAIESDLIQGRAKTVTPTQAVKRLANIAAVSLVGPDKTKDDHAKQVERILDLRNRAAHFTLSSEAETGIRVQLGGGLHFVLWFLETQFKGAGSDNTQALVEEVIADIAGELHKVEGLVRVRMTELKAILDTARICVDCPTCLMPTLMLGTDIAHCPFCLSGGTDGDTIANEYVENVLKLSAHVTIKDGGEWPIHTCPECDQQALVEGVRPRRPSAHDLNPKATPPCDWIEPIHWACFQCGLIATLLELSPCSRCGELILTGDISICSDCIAALV